jgi:hypothetical protein
MRRRVLTIGVLVAAAVIVIAALLWQPAPSSMQGASAPATTAPPRVPLALPTVKPTVAPPPTGTRELCGWGRYELLPSPTGLPTAVQQAADQALRQMVTTLIAGNERSRASGLALRAALDYHVDLPAQEDPAAVASAYERAAASSAADRDALARLALGSRDAEVYKTAYLACVPQPTAGACAQLTAAEWARRDPDDGLAWLFAAQEAHNAKDPAARDDAIYRLSQASRMSAAWQSISAHAGDPSLATLPTPTRIGAVLSLMLLQANQPVPTYGALVDFCSKATVSDPLRRDQCSAVANVLVEHDSTLIGQMVGMAVAERVGWPAARLTALRDQRDALNMLETEQSMTVFADPTSCAGFAAFSNFVELHGRLGEFGLLRERLRQSTEPVPVLAQRWRERMKATAATASSQSPVATTVP